ncbi:TonB-dependent siderophore receptor [Aquisalimonas asiatica]|uniref:Iron complex outermembrane recepter protein n=1 Tax=Aquisalimonas asiatica TaxID=406100 RepID=A0A1H8S413_9GAMM|nr:TonB-dependent receptor [Aquisalimonas asiatica]SEO73390.1 iron complex outermembrane recepter protein [Aquisalimonas asiatica]
MQDSPVSDLAVVSVLFASLALGVGSFAYADDDAEGSEPTRLTPLLIDAAPDTAGYRSMQTTGALGMPADTRDVPQSVGVVTRETIEDTGSNRVYDALNFIPGTSEQNDFGGIWDSVAIRGFEGDENRGPVFLRDGVRANRGFSSRQDSASVERLEVLKGPASALFGRGDPGGAVNIITKRPEFEPRREVTASVNSEMARRGSLDVTGPFTDNVAYRLNAVVERGDTFRDRVDEERYVLAPALTWRISPKTQLDYDGEFSRQDRPFDRGIPAIDGSFGTVPVSNFYGEPDDGTTTTDNVANRLRLNHDLNADWSTQFTLSHQYSSLDGFSTEQFSPEGDQLPRQRRFRDFESNDLVGVAELRGWLTTGAIQHQILAGVEASRFEQDYLMQRSNVDDDPNYIDIHNPQYGQTPPEFDPGQRDDRETTENTQALYLQNQMHLTPEFRLLLGGRLDHFEQRVRFDESHLGGSDNTRLSQTQTAFSPRAGVTWDVHDTTTVFASAARSFDPNSRVTEDPDGASETLDPQTSTAFEVGTKSLFLDGRLGLDLSVFRIRKENVPSTAPEESEVTHVSAGEVESRGFEVDVNMTITEQWRASISYAYTDARDLADGEDIQSDVRVRNVPRHKGSLLTRYDWTFADDQSLSLVGGLVYVGARPGARNDEDFELPSYTTTRLRGTYRPMPNLDLTLNVENLFDEEYYRSSFFDAWVTPGAPRTVTVQASYRF